MVLCLHHWLGREDATYLVLRCPTKVHLTHENSGTRAVFP